MMELWVRPEPLMRYESAVERVLPMPPARSFAEAARRFPTTYVPG